MEAARDWPDTRFYLVNSLPVVCSLVEHLSKLARWLISRLGALSMSAMMVSDDVRQVAPEMTRPGRFRHPWMALGVLIALVLPLILWRAHLESSFWIDEVYSVLLTTYPVPDLIEITASDANPPGYYIALKAWIKSGRLFGREPGVFWSRLLNVAAWLALAASAWLGGRRLLGNRAAVLFVWGIAGSAPAALVARDIRGYGLATVALFIAFMALLLSIRDPHCRRSQAVCWGLYAAAASIALWVHLLSAIALAWLSLLWAALLVRRRQCQQPFLAGALLGHLVPILVFVPWLLRLKEQLEFLGRSQPEWMTPPTWANLSWVFTFWYPFGRLGEPFSPENRWLVPLGLVAVLAPLAALLSRRTSESRFPFQLAALGLGTSALFVLTLWTLDRLDLAHTFHGPRYPLLTANLFAAGLVFALVRATSRSKRTGLWSVLLLFPWLLSSALGQGILAARESRWGLPNLLPQMDALMPEKGERIYVMPSELIPYVRRSLRKYEIHRIEDLPCEARGSAAVLDVNFWKNIDRPRDHLVRYLIESSALADAESQRKFPEPGRAYALYRLEGLHEERLQELCSRGFSSRFARELQGASSRALAENQYNTTYWSFVETNPRLEISRWSISARTPVIFDKPLAAGKYVLHVRGYRAPQPVDPCKMSFKLRARGDLAASSSVGSGPFELVFPVRLERPLKRPILFVEHALWSPAEVSDSNDTRQLSFLFYAAWFESTSGKELRSSATGDLRTQ